MNIAENLTLLAQTKENIRQAIITMGGEVESGTPFSAYTQAILAIPTGGGSGIPEGLWQFDVSQEGGTNVMWVESFMEWEIPNDPVSTVVNIYEDPNGEPINSITYEFTPKFSQEVITQTNSSAGLYAAENTGAIDTNNDPRTVGISCNTAGTYYIEVVGHTNPRFYDDTNTEIYPNNYVNS